MPHIEVLPNTSTVTAPGWAYVADTGYDPSKAPIIPSGARKRAARNNAVASGDHTARQQSKIARHLADLDKENNKDVQIIIPDRPRDVAKRGLHAHMTPGVKKILLSQKTFANHLADEEALLTTQGTDHTAAPSQRQNHVRDGRPSQSSAHRSSLTGLTSSSDLTDVATQEELDMQANNNTSNAPDSSSSLSKQASDKLLRLNLPPLPSSEEIDALLSLPTLSYSAARAAPSKSSAPAHAYCEMCGYWGRARCMKCGARICSLECKTTHEETTCQKF